jgi:putative component of membrane protein insertase Oxa1/YidC/SpoIIIJ protein YidD
MISNNQQTHKTFFTDMLVSALFAVRPLFGPAYCYFSPSCTFFAKEQLETRPLHKALFGIITRLMLCSPLYPVLLRYGFVRI